MSTINYWKRTRKEGDNQPIRQSNFCQQSTSEKEPDKMEPTNQFDKKEARKARAHSLHEWERLQVNIRELSKALPTETNEMLKHDMEADIVVLINRKKQLSNRLHID